MSRILPVLPCLLALAAAPALAQAVDPQNPYARPPAPPVAPTAAPPLVQPPPCPAASGANDQVYVGGQWMHRDSGLLGAAQDYWSRMHPFAPPPPPSNPYACPPTAPAAGAATSPTPPPGR